MLKKFLKNINLPSLIKYGRFNLQSRSIKINSSSIVTNPCKSLFSSKDESNACIAVEEESKEGEPEKIQINCKLFFTL